jgi:3-isopropylmalate/(R)-2-methylmalate dehydratase small subunit
VAAIQQGERVTVDLERLVVKCEAGEYPFPPLSPSIMGIIEAGGLIAYVKRKLASGT